MANLINWWLSIDRRASCFFLYETKVKSLDPGEVVIIPALYSVYNTVLFAGITPRGCRVQQFALC